ncbi:MAG: flagellar FlbD family protein [Chloroflexota bacterium]
MIRLTRLNGTEIFVSVELIRFVEALPDTVISLTDDDKLNVREKPPEIIEAIVAYRRRVNACRFPEQVGGGPPPGPAPAAPVNAPKSRGS